MENLIYGLCALTAASCTALLFRGYFASRYRLLLWSGLCFAGLTANNVLLILDKAVFTWVDLTSWRLGLALASVLLLLCGLILESSS